MRAYTRCTLAEYLVNLQLSSRKLITHCNESTRVGATENDRKGSLYWLFMLV